MACFFKCYSMARTQRFSLRNKFVHSIAAQRNKSGIDFKTAQSELISSFQTIHDDLTTEEDKSLSSVMNRVGKMLQYNVLGGKYIRGTSVVLAYKSLSSKETVEHDLRLAHSLGWCVELLQAFFVVIDDIMDNGTTRRGKSCWFRLPDVGLQGINDGLMLEACIYKLLKIHFSSRECYMNILDSFHTVTRQTIYGQCLDMMANPTGLSPQFEMFQPSYYWKVCEYKTAYYTFCLPVQLAMFLIGEFGAQHFASAKAICLKLGKFFQMQDDFLDAYGNVESIGKYRTDIQEGKCTWFAITALQHGSEKDKEIFRENYGIKNKHAVQKVQQLYDALNLKDKYFDSENSLHLEITSLINELDCVLMKDLFVTLSTALFRREK